MNEQILNFLNLTRNNKGVPILINDSDFDLKSLPGAIKGNFTEEEIGDDGHGTNCGIIIREIMEPTLPLHLFNSPMRMTEPLEYAIKNGIKVISVSQGKCKYTKEDDELARRYDIAIVNSAGNHGKDWYTWMGWSDWPFIIGAYNINKQKMEGYSSICPELDFSAPTGWEIKLWNGNIIDFIGTSASAPVVAAMISILRYRFPSLTVNEIRKILYGSCTDVGLPGYDTKSGMGVVKMPVLSTLFNKLVYKIGSKDFYFNGEKNTMDVAPKIEDGRTMMPVRFVVEKMGGKIDYTVKADGSVDEIEITW